MKAMLKNMKESWRCTNANAIEYSGLEVEELDEKARLINHGGGRLQAIRLLDKLLVFRDWAAASHDKDVLKHISSWSIWLQGQQVDMLDIFQLEPGCSRTGEVFTFVPRWGVLPQQLLQQEAKRIREIYDLEAVARSSKLLVSLPPQVIYFKGYTFELRAGLLLKPGYDESGDLLEFSYPSNLLEPEEAAGKVMAEAKRLSEAVVGGGNLDFIPVGPSLYVASDPSNNWVSLNWLSVNKQLECWSSRMRSKTPRYTTVRSNLFKFVPDQDRLFLSHGYIVDEAQALEAAQGRKNPGKDGIPIGIRPLCIIHDMSHNTCMRSERQSKLDELTGQVSRGWAQMAAIITSSGVKAQLGEVNKRMERCLGHQTEMSLRVGVEKMFGTSCSLHDLVVLLPDDDLGKTDQITEAVSGRHRIEHVTIIFRQDQWRSNPTCTELRLVIVVVMVHSGGVVSETDQACIDLSPVLPGCTIYLEDIKPCGTLEDIVCFLCDAVEDCNLELVKLCTARLPILDHQDGRGRMPLVVAALNGYIDIALYLMEQGASVQVEDGDGVSPLIAATVEGNDSLIETFRDAGATCDFGGAIFLARGRGNDYVVKGLEAAGYTCPVSSTVRDLKKLISCFSPYKICK